MKVYTHTQVVYIYVHNGFDNPVFPQYNMEYLHQQQYYEALSNISYCAVLSDMEEPGLWLLGERGAI